MGHYDEYGRFIYDMDDYDDYYEDLSFMHLCCSCIHLQDEPSSVAGCSKYPKMTAEMFGRKKKCKHYNDHWEIKGGGRFY